MTTYKYTSPENTAVHIIDDDGVSRSSCLASVLPIDAVIEPADVPVVDIRAQIDQLERDSLLPRVTREFMLLSFATTAAGMGVDPTTNVAYVKVKELDDRIALLRSSL